MKIEIKNLNFGYSKEKLVLKNINLSFENISTLAIVGSSGCGKSTLLRLIAGLISQNKENHITGHISINDKSVFDYAKSGDTGFMFQDTALFPNYTVRKNVILPLKLHRYNHLNSFERVIAFFGIKKIQNLWKMLINKKAINTYEDADRIIEMVGLTEFKNFLPKNLSGGMKTRVSLAQTFVNKPKLLLLDEPFSALDIRWRYILYRELDKLQNQYKPLTIIVTHDIQEALLLSNNIVVFNNDGTILENLIINKPLPRIYDLEAIKHLQAEYIHLQKLIMGNNFQWQNMIKTNIHEKYN